jgi:hypothetical protein
MEENIIILPIVMLLLCGPCAMVEETSPDKLTTNESLPPTIPDPYEENDSGLDVQWDQITEEVVEDNCLNRAKEAAREASQPTFLIFSCRCEVDETEERKSFYCTVNAADAQHPVTVACVKDKRECLVSSEQGTDSFTFDELEELIE